jgi:ribose 5-phosphate isomerase B
MRVALGADHAGVALKEEVKRVLEEWSVGFEDFGAVSEESVDYPAFAAKVALAVAAGDFQRGVLLCGSGIGMAIAANKVRGIRAAPVVDLESTRLSRQHNDANVLAIGARLTPPSDALEMVKVFLDTPFEGGRHQRRIEQIAALECGSTEKLP